MTLVNLRNLARAMIPGAKSQVIDGPTLDLILNEGVKDIVAYTLCLKANKKFNVVAGQSEYILSSVIGDYLSPDKSGLWWDNGTKWQVLYPRTLKYLDEFRPNWRDMENANPMEYSIEADILTISPPPETALTNGFWFYYVKQATSMTQDTDYPFSGSATELTHLSIFDMAIILYARKTISPMLNKDQDANMTMQEYLQEREIKKNQFYKRLDLMNSPEARLKGSSVRR